MDVTVRNNKVEVIIVADNKDVQQTLNTNIDHLKGSLQNQGLTIDRCDVLMQSNREGYPQNFSQQTFYRDGSEKNSNTSKEKFSEGSKPVTSMKPSIISISNPLLSPDNISIFA
jgi:flagellar hook-length control protein FliK